MDRGNVVPAVWRLLMKHGDFVVALEALSPKGAELRKLGLSESFISGVMARYRCVRRPSGEPDTENELMLLLSEFDCQKVEIGLIRFFGRCIPYGESGGLQVGMCEGDPLVVCRDGKVVVCDHAWIDRVIFTCASSGAEFLSAVLRFAEIVSQAKEWKGKAQDVARVCSNLSGSSESVVFFLYMSAFLNSNYQSPLNLPARDPA